MKVCQYIFSLFILFGCVQKSQAQCPFEVFVDVSIISCDVPCADVFVGASGGMSPYTYSFDNGMTFQTDQNFVNCESGTFIVMVMDAAGIVCEEVYEVVIDANIPVVTIIGPDCLPPNGEAELFAEVSGGSTGNFIVQWSNGETGQSIFVGEPGTYCVTVTDGQNSCFTEACYEVEAGGFTPNIEVVAGAVCFNPDSLSSTCQKVCTNTVVTYQVTNANGAEVEWTIEGAIDFEVNDDQVTVTWGEAGFGEVTATVGDPGNPTLQPLSLYCGQYSETGPDGNGTGYVFFEGSIPPYTYNVDGSVIQTVTNSGLNILEDLEIGDHIVTVTDGTGQTYTCLFFINEGGCFLSAYPSVTPSTPNACSGAIDLTVVGGVNASTAIFWTGSNGFSSSEEDIFGLCCGDTYTVNVFDQQNCFDSLEVTIPCGFPQGCGGETTLCVEILENPIAQFDTNPAASGGTVDVCKGQPIEFFNTSVGASTYIWDFGDFTNSVLENPIHTYPQAGQYEVSLIARNDCFCADTTTLIINVSDLEIPTIECVGTVCKGETVTYETVGGCGSYSWTITGDATIIEGGTPSDNFITVEWNEGPEGTVELMVSSCNPALCDASAVALIPILTDDVSLIEGPDKVCPNEIVNYAITDFGGSEFTWSVSGGNILEGQGTHQITVEWTGSPIQNPHSVSVNYENCFLNCGGSDELDVNIRSEFFISGPIEICQNESADYDAINAGMMIGVNVNWSLLNSAGMTIQTAGPSSSTNIDFSLPVGNYTLQAVPQSLSSSCNAIYEIPVAVTALPVAPTAINGTDLICPGTAYTYTASGLPAHQFHWQINNGGVMSEDFGNQLNVVWGASPPYELQLSQIAIAGLQCESETISFTANAIPSFTLSGTEQICREQSGFYAADVFENIVYDWTITPSDAGTIIDGMDTDNIEIFWHSAGNHTVSVDICGMTETINVTVFDLPEPTAVFPALLCPYEEGPVSTTQVYDAYEWRNEIGEIISTDPNPGLIPGYYEVIVTDANGCTGNDIFKIEGLPQPNISISSPDILGLCPSGSITLYAIEITGGYSYQWYQDGVATGTDDSTLEIFDAGSYYTIVTDANGCTAQSNTLTFIDCATAGGTCVNGFCLGSGGGNPGPGCTPDGTVDFTFNTTAECNIIEFQNTSINYLPGSETWNFRDFDSSDNFSSLPNPAHLFTKPGFFRVRLSVTLLDAAGQPCGTWYTEKPVMVPAAADFLTDQGCVGSPVQFNDHSAFLPAEITEITSWSWDFGDPASGAANTSTDQNPTHTYADDAFYTVTLTITTTEGCTSTVQKQVSVNQAPEITFLPPAINCQNTSLEFVLDYPADNNIVNVIWDFDDPASGDANSSIQETTYHIYETPGSYDVIATATNIYGCTATYTATVTVEPNNLTGTIDPPAPSPICEGESLDLTASPGGSFWNWSTGEITETISVNEEGVYSVTVTDDDGCTYSPAPVLVEIIPAPIGTIRAVEYNEFDQPTAYFDDGYTVCEGEDVYLFAQTSADYAFEWTTGEITQDISFTDDKGNLLPAGTHNYSVTITNTTTGCTSIAGPFEVVINPTPNNVTISSSPGGALCDGSAATLSVDSPDPNLTYVWNTGEQGTSIMVFSKGDYFVRAINSFGCEGESNVISIENAPNINAVPSGCHFSCLPDTICLPNIPNIASYQWYMDGVAIPAPEGTVADLIITESGAYTVEMTDIFGCTATSDPVTMTLVPGFGNILGEVWFDVNENGVIDGPDTLVSNMEIILIDNGMFLDTAVTNANGFYGFANEVSSNNYTLLFNTALLPPMWNVYQATQNAALNGCDDETTVSFLLYDNCVSPPSALTIETCEGSQIEYDGVMLNAGDVQDFTLMNQFQCDSVVTVTVAELTTYDESVELKACQGSTVEYEGLTLSPGDVEVFNLQTFGGCDSTITVMVDEVVPSFSQVDLEVCKDGTVMFMSQEFGAGTTEDFVFTDQYGCDSTITLAVNAYPEITFDLTAEEICFNATDGAIEVIDVQGGATGLEYSLDGTTYQATALFEDLPAGVYDVFVRDDNGCVYENMIEMPTIAALNVVTENAIIDCEDEGVKLEPTVTNANPTDLIWEWSDGSTEPTFFAQENGTYSYSVTNNCQTETGQIEVNWAKDGRTRFFYIPNVFSPNGDGANDAFFAHLEQNIEVQKFSLQVFDRWGNQIFETDNYLDQWNGNFKGKAAKQGVYVVYLDATIVACGRTIRERLEGDVTIMK